MSPSAVRHATAASAEAASSSRMTFTVPWRAETMSSVGRGCCSCRASIGPPPLSHGVPQPVGQASLVGQALVVDWAIGGDEHAGKERVEEIAQQQAQGGSHAEACGAAAVVTGSVVDRDEHVSHRDLLRDAAVEEEVQRAARDEGEREQDGQRLPGTPGALVSRTCHEPAARAPPSDHAVEQEADQQGADACHE
eukprot:scaffold104050_cov57-Phaeocystis_antarctica.AAC.2